MKKLLNELELGQEAIELVKKIRDGYVVTSKASNNHFIRSGSNEIISEIDSFLNKVDLEKGQYA